MSLNTIAKKLFDSASEDIRNFYDYIDVRGLTSSNIIKTMFILFFLFAPGNLTAVVIIILVIRSFLKGAYKVATNQ